MKLEDGDPPPPFLACLVFPGAIAKWYSGVGHTGQGVAAAAAVAGWHRPKGPVKNIFPRVHSSSWRLYCTYIFTILVHL